MNFFEYLRKQNRQKGLKELERIEAAKAQHALFETQQGAMLKKETFHQEQRERARQTIKESGIELLLDELAGLIGREVFPFFRSYNSRDIQERNVHPRDIDSWFSIFQWERHDKKTGEKQWLDVIHTYYDCTAKYFITESCPDGVIKIHTTRSSESLIFPDQWRNNRSVLEDALEKAFNQPLIYKWVDISTFQKGDRPI